MLYLKVGVGKKDKKEKRSKHVSHFCLGAHKLELVDGTQMPVTHKKM